MYIYYVHIVIVDKWYIYIYKSIHHKIHCVVVVVNARCDGKYSDNQRHYEHGRYINGTWAPWLPKSLATRLFIKQLANFKDNIKVRYFWSLVRGIQRSSVTSNAESISRSWPPGINVIMVMIMAFVNGNGNGLYTTYGNCFPRFGRRPTVIVCSMIRFAACLLCVAVTNVWIYTILRFVVAAFGFSAATALFIISKFL